MIDFYTWKTPNGRKVAIMLEETGLPYTPHFINLMEKEQFTPAYLKINPNNKIPAIVDHEGPNNQPLTLFESGAILLYLAEKTGKFLPKDPRSRLEAIQWLMFQMGGVGPMLGQLNHYLRFATEKVPYAIDRHLAEAKRLSQVMDKHLSNKEYFAGEYSIADIATFPWVDVYDPQFLNLEDYPNLKRWHDTIAKRPGIKKGLALI